jgi:hypothetical protein
MHCKEDVYINYVSSGSTNGEVRECTMEKRRLGVKCHSPGSVKPSQGRQCETETAESETELEKPHNPRISLFSGVSIDQSDESGNKCRLIRREQFADNTGIDPEVHNRRERFYSFETTIPRMRPCPHYPIFGTCDVSNALFGALLDSIPRYSRNLTTVNALTLTFSQS